MMLAKYNLFFIANVDGWRLFIKFVENDIDVLKLPVISEAHIIFTKALLSKYVRHIKVSKAQQKKHKPRLFTDDERSSGTERARW